MNSVSCLFRLRPCIRISRGLSTSSPVCYRYYTELADFTEREFNFVKMFTKKFPSLDAKLSRDELDEIADIVYGSLGQSSNKYIETRSDSNNGKQPKNTPNDSNT